MGGILDKLDEWLRGLLIEGITGNLSGMFDTVNTKVGEIAGEVGQTPLAWNSGVFSMIRNLSETVIVPIAGVILTFVMCYELIQLVTEKNNLHDVDTWMFFTHALGGAVRGKLVAVTLGAHDADKGKARGRLPAVVDDVLHFGIQAALHQCKGHAFQ